MTEEIWRPVEGYEGLYEVSSYGRVKSLYFNKLLSPGKDKDGYLRVTLCKDKIHKCCFIHRLVAQAFIENPCNLPQINHIDEDKKNNIVDNLEWCDNLYNNLYGTRVNRIMDTKVNRGLVDKEMIGLSIRDHNRKYYIKNRDNLLMQKKEYYQENKEKKKEYYEKNKEKIRDYHHQYYLKRKAGL